MINNIPFKLQIISSLNNQIDKYMKIVEKINILITAI